MESPIGRYVKSEFRLVDASTLLTRPVTALLGVTPAGATILEALNVETVFDLASSVTFGAARRIAEAAEDPNSEMALSGAVPLDLVDLPARTIPVGELQMENVERLRGVSEATATQMASTLSIVTIRDAAFWPPYLAARQIVNITLGGTDEEIDQELPAELVPRMGRYPTERLQYDLLLLDKVVDPAPDLHIGTHAAFPRKPPRGPIESAGVPLERAGPLDVAVAISADAGFQKPALGALVTFTQSWYTLGLSLGHLLHALALAPGESTRIAVVDWSRRSSTQSSESISESDSLQSALDRGRSISEVANAVAHELQTGEGTSFGTGASLALGEGGGAAGGAEYGMFKGAAAGGHSTGFSAGAGFARSWASSAGTRDISAETTQRIIDSTHQASSMVRSRRATAIREISQSEHETLSTRSVTNFNHMHALTVQYYEIVQVYKTVNELARVQRCIFIPMRPVDFSSRAIVARFRAVLAAAALTPAVRATILSTPNAVVLTAARRSQPWSQGNLDLLGALFNTTVGYPEGEEIVLPRNLQPWGLMLGQTDDPTNTREFPFESVVLEFDGGATRTLPITELGANQASDLGRKYVDFRTALGTGENARDFWNVRAISLRRKAGKEDFAGEIFVTAAIYPFGTTGGATQGRGSLPLMLRVEANEALVRVYSIARTVSNDELASHFADNSLYYSQVIWRSLDAPTLGLLLSPYTLQGRPLVELVDPTPLAVAGNYLVFRTYAEDAAWAAFLKDKGLQVGRVRESLVPLPSGGVFAEAVLGRANSAERLDITRFWNWQDSPIPIAAPEIAALQSGSRAQAEDLAPGRLGEPTVNIITGQDLPDPQGMSGILSAIQNGNMFRDMSGLNATIGFAQSAMTRAFDAARDAAAQAGKNAETAADVLKTMYSKGGTSGGSGSEAGGGDSGSSKGGGRELPATPSNLGSLINQGRSLDQRESSADPASEWAAWPGDASDGLSAPPLVSTDNERAATYGTTPPARTGGGKAKARATRIFVEGRVTRDEKATGEPVSGLLTLLMSQQLAANSQDAGQSVQFDLVQGVGSNTASLVPGEQYVVRPKITVTGNAIANRLDEMLAAIRFEVPGLDLATLKSEVRNKLADPESIDGTGRTLVVPSGTKPYNLELLARVETLANFSTEITLDGALGFTGATNAKAGFDLQQVGKFATAIAKLIKDPRAKAAANAVSGILSMFTLSIDYGVGNTASGDIKVGNKLVLVPQLLRSIEIREKG